MKSRLSARILVIAFGSLPVVGIVIQSGLVRPAQAQEGCSLGILQGEYVATGTTEARLDQRDDPSYPRVVIGIWNFDGKGAVTASATQSFGGTILRLEGQKGSYEIDSDRCVATVTFPSASPTVWEAIISRGGREAAALRVDIDATGRGAIATRFLKRW